MEVPEYEETKKKLMEDGMEEDEIEEELEKLSEQYDGMVSAKPVLADILAKQRGVVRSKRPSGGSKSEGTPTEVTIKEMQEMEEDEYVILKGFVVQRDLSETKNGDEMSFITVVDETGSCRGTVFGEASEDWLYEFGQAVVLEGDTYKGTRGPNKMGISTWNDPRVISEEKLDYSLDDSVQKKIDELDEVEDGEFIMVDGLCSDEFINEYEGCQNCRAKMENCNCEGKFGTKTYRFDKVTLMTADGEYSVGAQAGPTVDVPEDMHLDFVKVYGIYNNGDEDEDEEDEYDDDIRIEITKAEKVTNTGKAPTQKKDSESEEEEDTGDVVELSDDLKDTVSCGMFGAEALTKIMTFVKRFDEVPDKMLVKFVENNTDVSPAENVPEQMVEDGILKEKDGDFVIGDVE